MTSTNTILTVSKATSIRNTAAKQLNDGNYSTKIANLTLHMLAASDERNFASAESFNKKIKSLEKQYAAARQKLVNAANQLIEAENSARNRKLDPILNLMQKHGINPAMLMSHPAFQAALRPQPI
jgi:uncharacterized protein (DUF342 family)